MRVGFSYFNRKSVTVGCWVNSIGGWCTYSRLHSPEWQNARMAALRKLWGRSILSSRSAETMSQKREVGCFTCFQNRHTVLFRVYQIAETSVCKPKKVIGDRVKPGGRDPNLRSLPLPRPGYERIWAIDGGGGHGGKISGCDGTLACIFWLHSSSRMHVQDGIVSMIWGWDFAFLP